MDAARLEHAFDLLRGWVEDGTLPSASALVARRGVVVGRRWYGDAVRNPERKPIGPDTLFAVASITKPFTATAIMQLAEWGRFSVDQPVHELLPEFAALRDVVRVIDVPAAANGQVLRILMNADLDEAIGFLATPGTRIERRAAGPDATTEAARAAEYHWRWRLQMAERIARDLDPERFGVVAVYVFGSTKNATAGPGSDIDLLIHVRASPAQRDALENWLDGWSLALAEMNFRRCGYRTDRLLDAHVITDDDIARRDSFASKIGAITDAARPLPIGAQARPEPAGGML